jgi:hypothetical protein
MSVGPTGRHGVAKGSFGSRGGEAQGFGRDQAIRRISIETGLDPEKVRWCVESVFGAAPVPLSPALRRRRATLAIAAVL